MGHLTVHRVPIFVECKRGDTDYDATWIAEAVRKAKLAELEGYFPPLHIRHHGDGETVQPAGFFKVIGAGPITFKGTTRTAIYADLVVTVPGVEEDLLKARLPYRSVEIFNVDDPAINSLALLDHEPPYLELPMLMVAEADPCEPGASPIVSSSVANATFANPWQSEAYVGGDPVVACFRRGQSAHILIQDENPMAAKQTNTRAFFSDDDYDGDDKKEEAKKDDENGEQMDGDAEGGVDIGEVVKAITDGSISVADMEAIKAAIIEQQGQVGAEAEEAEEPQAAPAPSPGGAMKRAPAQFAAMQGKIDAQGAKIAAMEDATRREKAISEALERLEGRPLGADPEAKFQKFYRDHGADAFAAYINEYAATFAAIAGNSDSKAAAFSLSSTPASKTALTYTEAGTEAVDKATTFSAEHEQLSSRGLTRMSEEKYVAFNMNRLGFEAPAVAK